MTKLIIPADLVNHLKDGGALKSHEVESVYEALLKREQDSDVHNLLRALAMSSPPIPAYRKLAEDVLRERREDWWVQGALYALCYEWNIVSPYLSELKELIQVSSWAQFSNSAITAFSILGKHLYVTQDPDLYRVILSLVDEDTKLGIGSSENYWQVHLEAALAALDEGIRGPESLINPMEIRTPLEIPSNLLKIARERAGR